MAKVVLVEDDKITLKVLQLIIKRSGHEVIGLSDGRKIDNYIKDPSITNFVVDLNIPFISGEELVSKIHAKRPDVHLFITSGTPKNQINDQLINKCIGYIEKPYTNHQIAIDLIDQLKE